MHLCNVLGFCVSVYVSMPTTLCSVRVRVRVGVHVVRVCACVCV